VFGGPIAFDPCACEGSLVAAERDLIVPWGDIWSAVNHLADAMGSEGGPLHSPDDCRAAVAVLHWEIKSSDVSPQARALVATLREYARRTFAHVNGAAVPWLDRTFINPPFGDKGPECLLANFADFCAAFARTEVECALLGPVRTHRKWWRRDVMQAADAIVYLDPIKFEGFAQTFPAPLCLAYKGPNSDRVPEAFASLGGTVWGQPW